MAETAQEILKMIEDQKDSIPSHLIGEACEIEDLSLGESKGGRMIEQLRAPVVDVHERLFGDDETEK